MPPRPQRRPAASERISDRDRTRLRGLLDTGDPHGEVRSAWHAKQTVRGIYDIDTQPLRSDTPTRLADDLQDESRPPEINKLGRTIARWTPQIANWHISKVTTNPPNPSTT
ncbi:MAG: transposase [bacterium]|nr:transposase [bacterium]MDE0289925.1 transposase [bacterium]MDE0440418.1 transposase [bacterium]